MQIGSGLSPCLSLNCCVTCLRPIPQLHAQRTMSSEGFSIIGEIEIQSWCHVCASVTSKFIRIIPTIPKCFGNWFGVLHASLTGACGTSQEGRKAWPPGHAEGFPQTFSVLLACTRANWVCVTRPLAADSRVPKASFHVSLFQKKKKSSPAIRVLNLEPHLKMPCDFFEDSLRAQRRMVQGVLADISSAYVQDAWK